MLSELLSANQNFGLIELGAVFWATAAVMIRSMPELLFGTQSRQIFTLAATAPLSYYGIIRPAEIILGISPLARVYTAIMMSTSALLLDGIAMM